MNETFSRGCHGFELWPELEVQAKDLIVDKTRFGAFVPGSSDLHDILQARHARHRHAYHHWNLDG
jgi:ureidoacrylate peracid hydrolase